MKTGAPSRTDRFLYLARIKIRRYKATITTLLSGVLIGCIVNILSVPDTNSFKILYESIVIDRKHSFFVIFWGTIGLLILVVMAEKLLTYHHRKRRYEHFLARLINDRTEPIASPFTKDTIAWGASISLQIAPEITQGWKLDEIILRYSIKEFSLPPDLLTRYQAYVQENFERKRFFDDGTKLMLTHNPSSFSDSPTLALEIQKCKYSEIQFYRDTIAVDHSERSSLINDLLKDHIRFPHSLCMHAVVMTTDKRVLVTQRSSKVAYFPDSWSISIEEQLSPDDLLHGSHVALSQWAIRFLYEELGVEHEDYDIHDFRVLSVFLEANILNCSLCSILKLSIHSSELDTILKVKARTDYEFHNWMFMKFSELISELKLPSRLYHPTSGYRMLLGLLHYYGTPNLIKLMFNCNVRM